MGYSQQVEDGDCVLLRAGLRVARMGRTASMRTKRQPERHISEKVCRERFVGGHGMEDMYAIKRSPSMAGRRAVRSHSRLVTNTCTS